MDQLLQQHTTNGWCVLERAIDSQRMERLRSLVGRLGDSRDEGVRQSAGAVYAARNVVEVIPEVLLEWQAPLLVDFVQRRLGSTAGLVRILYFDKPPEQTWALPWHKDLLIAVQSDQAVVGYSPPRPRAGVLHTEPPVEVLESMLTLRLHLDENTLENGPLRVASGSHKTGKQLQLDGFEDCTICTAAGDVLAMTPLLAHCSGRSIEGTTHHRRTLHLEFSSLSQLPGGHQWKWFLRNTTSA